MSVKGGDGGSTDTMTSDEQATVLIVEDEQELADTYARWLNEDFTVRIAYTGKEAIRSLSNDIDVVLLDRRLPDIPGQEVLAELRDRGIDSRIAIITAVDPDFDIIDMDFEDYIVKPVLKSELQDIVDRLIRLSTFDKRVQESFAIASKIEVLDTEKTHAELSANEDYEALRQRLNELQDSIQDLFAEFDHRDFTTVYSELKTAEQDDR